MTRYLLGICALTLGLVGCGDGDGLGCGEEKDLGTDCKVGDSDLDGLLDGEEVDLGTDPTVADTDGDRLLDGEELSMNCDPNVWDTDGDGYADGDEVATGHDPLNADDKIYTGNWPFNPNKAELGEPSWETAWKNGEVIGHHIAKDQFGDEVDLYDFAGQGKDIIIDVSASWCQPCQLTSLWLATEGQEDYMGNEAEYKKVRKAVENGDVYWITILAEDNGGSLPKVGDLKDWDDQFGHELIPVITDKGHHFLDGVVGATGFFPSGALVDENFEILKIGHINDAMDKAKKRLNE